MTDTGMGERIDVPTTFEEFLNHVLVDSADCAIFANVYRGWRKSGGARPSEQECVGYIQPLFLGGNDSLDNVQVIDLDVYATLHGQLYVQVAGLPEGARIGSIKIGG